MRYFVSIPGTERAVVLGERGDGAITVTVVGSDGSAGGTFEAEILSRRSDGLVTVRVGGKVFDIALDGSAGDYRAFVNGESLTVGVESDIGRAAAHGHREHGDNLVVSPMPGKVVEVRVRPGESVERGTALVVVEAMKMQNELTAERSGVVAEVFVNAGDAVESGAPLLRIDG
jgi:biotin carboxyl carrier protein